MPGIAGVLALEPACDQHALARRMVGTMRHGPDDVHGMLHCPELGISAGWVAHEGSFAARQCSAQRPGMPRLLWAGECFAPDGSGTPPFDADAAGSPLAHYESGGEAFIQRLNGLFSGLLVDERRRVALLFNDRYGSERLYVHETRNAIFFASEAKAILAALPELRAFDEEGVCDFITFGSTLEGRTLFRNLTLLPGGSVWRFARGSAPRRSRYFAPEQWETQPALDARTFERRLSETLSRVMPGYARNDRAVGISITGGLDTRMIVSCLPPQERDATCYTYAARRGETLDVRIGRRIAAMRGLPHQTLRPPRISSRTTVDTSIARCTPAMAAPARWRRTRYHCRSRLARSPPCA
jgi:asparagine synthase (glutamine-hydrolysing)